VFEAEWEYAARSGNSSARYGVLDDVAWYSGTPFAAFHTPMDYYSTRAHETGHWTSKADRCNRELGKRFGDNAYAMEELVAELSAAFTMAHVGLRMSASGAMRAKPLED
jgi:antirestriction protein ArdC